MILGTDGEAETRLSGRGPGELDLFIRLLDRQVRGVIIVVAGGLVMENIIDAHF